MTTADFERYILKKRYRNIRKKNRRDEKKVDQQVTPQRPARVTRRASDPIPSSSTTSHVRQLTFEDVSLSQLVEMQLSPGDFCHNCCLHPLTLSHATRYADMATIPFRDVSESL